jgi:hypothetical protein
MNGPTDHRKIFAIAATIYLTLLLGAQAQDKPARIKTGLWQSVVRLESHGVGAGFMVSDAITRGPNTQRIRFLITNKHVIGDYNLADGNIRNFYKTLNIWNYREDGKATPLTIVDTNGAPRKNFVFMHPDPKIDIAMIALLDEGVDVKGWSFDISYLEAFSETNWVCFGDQIFALGYPNGIHSMNNSVPIAKAGYLSSLPGEPFRLNIGTTNRQGLFCVTDFEAKVYIVDGLLVPGNSGGPVIMPSENFFRHNPTNDALEFTKKETLNKVIGIMSMSLGNINDTGLSIVYSSDYIIEMIKLYENTIVRFEGNSVIFK